MNTFVKAGLAAFAVIFATATGAFAAKPEIYVNKKWDYAADGYDVTSYFQGEPVKGNPEFAAQVANATYIFASQENLDKFNADQAQYRPQYGGHCAYALAVRGIAVKGDPLIWRIEDNRLFLNLNKKVQTKFINDIDNMITKADGNWPEVLTK